MTARLMKIINIEDLRFMHKRLSSDLEEVSRELTKRRKLDSTCDNKADSDMDDSIVINKNGLTEQDLRDVGLGEDLDLDPDNFLSIAVKGEENRNGEPEVTPGQQVHELSAGPFMGGIGGGTIYDSGFSDIKRLSPASSTSSSYPSSPPLNYQPAYSFKAGEGDETDTEQLQASSDPSESDKEPKSSESSESDRDSSSTFKSSDDISEDEDDENEI